MTEKLNRRQFVAGTAAGIALGGTVLACEDGAASPPVQPVQPQAEADAPAGGHEKPAEQAAQGEKAPEAEPKAAPVQEKAFPMNVRGKLVQVTAAGATEKIKKTNEEVVRKMVAEALMKFTGESDPVKAIGRFIKTDDVVGIKVNALGSPYAAVHPATAFALADLCHQLGIAKNKIYIYDQYGSRMRKAGYKLSRNPKGPADEYPVHFHGTLGYETAKVHLGGKNKHNRKPFPSQVPKLLKELTAVINLCCPKDHDLTGVTGALKNVAYGNIERVPIFHCKPECNPVCVHDGICNVAQIYKHEQLGGKVRLVVCDALRVLYQGGPQDNMTFKKAHNAVLVSTDPVAMDRAILEIVNGYRKERGLKPVEEDRGGRRAPRFIESAAKLGLGEPDLAKITWDKHELA